MALSKLPTLAAQMHETLRTEILRGHLAPGEPLRLAALATKYDASQSVVREALGRLAEHRLVVLSPNQGFRVVESSAAALVEITELRVMLEGEALRSSIEHGDMQWEAGLISAHHVLERVTAATDDQAVRPQEWNDAHAAFHQMLVSACRNRLTLELTNSLRDGAEFYRQLSRSSSHFKERDIPAEHRELVELASNRDLRAVEALERHLKRTTDDVLRTGLLQP